MVKFSPFVVILSCLWFGASALAQSNLDLNCGPRKGIFDTGFIVKAQRISPQLYRMQITQIYGWSPYQVEYDGPGYLIILSSSQGCQKKLVDNLTHPKTILGFHDTEYDVLEKLNGVELASKQERGTNGLNCVVSKAFNKDARGCSFL